MSQKAEFLQLETDDDVASVRDHLSFMRGKRILIVWPADGTVLNRKLDLVLIQREARRLAIRFAIVTHDHNVVNHAEELNISVFETIGASERGRWKRGRSKVFTTRFHRPADSPEPEELMDVASRVYGDEGEKARRGWLARLVFLLLVAAIIVSGAYVVAPSATVTIVPAQQRIPIEAIIVADPDSTDVNIENATIPAVTLRVEIEEEGTINTSGSESLSDVLAVGSVVFINQADQALAIPTDTVLSTSAGTPILFRTTQEATLPAQTGSQLEVPIEALPGSAGLVGNVDAGLINTVVGDIAQQVTVRNLSPTYGGESRTLSAVEQSDYDRLLATLRQQLQARAYLGMEEQVTEGQSIIAETIRIAEERDDWKTWSAEPGDVADQLTLTMRARVEATVIDEAFAQQIALALLNSEVTPGRSEIVSESISYRCCTVLAIDEAGRVTFTMSGEALIVSRVNAEQITNRLAGRSVDDAIQYLQQEIDLADGTVPQIELSPDILGQLPIWPQRIRIQIISLDV